jgi:hypothetical protein
MNHVREIDPHGIARRPATLLHGVGHALELASTRSPKRRSDVTPCPCAGSHWNVGRSAANDAREATQSASQEELPGDVLVRAVRGLEILLEESGIQISM